MSNKQLLQSAGDGTAVPAGCIGEIKKSYCQRGFSNNSSGGVGWSLNTGLTGDRTLTPGVWLVAYGVNINVTSGTTSSARASILTTDSTDGWPPSSNLSANYGTGNTNFNGATTSVADSRSGIAVVTVTSSGIVGGTGFNLYVKMYADVQTNFTGNYESSIVAVRIS